MKCICIDDDSRKYQTSNFKLFDINREYEYEINKSDEECFKVYYGANEKHEFINIPSDDFENYFKPIENDINDNKDETHSVISFGQCEYVNRFENENHYLDNFFSLNNIYEYELWGNDFVHVRNAFKDFWSLDNQLFISHFKPFKNDTNKDELEEKIIERANNRRIEVGLNNKVKNHIQCKLIIKNKYGNDITINFDLDKSKLIDLLELEKINV